MKLFAGLFLGAVVFGGLYFLYADTCGGSWCNVFEYAGPVTGGDLPPALRSGIEGFVSIGPVCGTGNDCTDEPYPARIVVLADTGERIAQTASGNDGWYAVELPAGTYVVRPGPSRKYPGAGLPESRFVEVPEGKVVRLNFSFAMP